MRQKLTDTAHARLPARQEAVRQHSSFNGYAARWQPPTYSVEMTPNVSHPTATKQTQSAEPPLQRKSSKCAVWAESNSLSGSESRCHQLNGFCDGIAGAKTKGHDKVCDRVS